jgi:dihydrofolate reductase
MIGKKIGRNILVRVNSPFSMKVSIIAAIGKNRELGKNNALLWDIPEDMRHFRDVTTGHAVIMGQKTYVSIGRPLPRRTNIIITRDTSFVAEGWIVCHSIEEALLYAQEKESEEVFVIGGASIYQQCIERAERLYLTLVDQSFDADVFFPEYEALFTCVVSERKSHDDVYSYTFMVLEKDEVK